MYHVYTDSVSHNARIHLPLGVHNGRPMEPTSLAFCSLLFSDITDVSQERLCTDEISLGLRYSMGRCTAGHGPG